MGVPSVFFPLLRGRTAPGIHAPDPVHMIEGFAVEPFEDGTCLFGHRFKMG